MKTNTKSAEYKRTGHLVYSCNYHISFCPKYRRKILTDGIDDRLKELIYEFAEKKQIDVKEMEVMPDHVHLLVEIYPDNNVLELVKQMKYYTAKHLKKEFPTINRRMPCLWTRSCFIATVGGAPLEIVKQYIENQKNV